MNTEHKARVKRDRGSHLNPASFNDLTLFIERHIDTGDATFQIVTSQSPGTWQLFIGVMVLHSETGFGEVAHLEDVEIMDPSTKYQTVRKWELLLKAAAIEHSAIISR